VCGGRVGCPVPQEMNIIFVTVSLANVVFDCLLNYRMLLWFGSW
jgi:hypothetical protein